MANSQTDIRKLIANINELASGESKETEDFWLDAGAKLFIFIDELIMTPEKIGMWLPKEYSKDNICILSAIFTMLEHVPNPNQLFKNSLWVNRNFRENKDSLAQQQHIISLYEVAYSRSCSLISQMLGDRFSYVQKLLIKNLFGASNICSLLASDIYIFIARIINPHNKMSFCQIIMNLCKLAPPEAFVKGAALINRFKHPVVNFENPKYQYLLNIS